MTENDPKLQPEKPTEYDLLVGLLGYDQSAEFGQAAGDWLARDTLTDSDQHLAAKLLAHGIDIDAAVVPQYLHADDLNDEDLAIIKDSEIPLIALYGIANALEPKKHDLAWKTAAENERVKYSNPLKIACDLARLRAMPLVHTTSVEGLSQMASARAMVSNREVYERQLADGDTDPESLMAGATHITDRKLGLDKYVFADFGRPSSIRPKGDVVIAIDPDVMEQPGVFMTEEDIADLDGVLESDQKTMEKYLRGALIPQRFYDAALRRILTARIGDVEERIGQGVYTSRSLYNTVSEFAQGQDMDPTVGGWRSLNFSTWEVKLPQVPVSAIRRVIVQSKEIFDQLHAEHGENIELILDPKFGMGHYDALTTKEEIDEQFTAIVDQDYSERIGLLDASKPEEVESVIMVLQSGEIDSKLVSERITERSNPFWYMPVTYPDESSVHEDISANSIVRPHRYSHWTRMLDDPTYDKDFVIVNVARLKSDPSICKITDITTINPSKITK
jgi:hypothetical protein